MPVRTPPAAPDPTGFSRDPVAVIRTDRRENVCTADGPPAARRVRRFGDGQVVGGAFGGTLRTSPTCSGVDSVAPLACRRLSTGTSTFLATAYQPSPETTV